MPRKQCLTEDALERYLDDRLHERPTVEMDRHLATCRRCRTLVDAAVTFPPATARAELARVDRLLANPAPRRIEPAQMWRLHRLAGADHHRIGVVTRGPAMSLDPEHPDIRFACANFDAQHDDLAADDVVVEADESPLARRCLIEYWNDRPIPVSLLERYLGRLGPAAWQRLRRALGHAGLAQPLPPRVEAFRAACVAEAEPLSAASLSRLVPHLDPPVPEDAPTTVAVLFEVLLPADESLPAAAAAPAAKRRTPFHRLGSALLTEVRQRRREVPLSGRETVDGFEFQIREPGRRMSLQLLDREMRVQAEVPASDGVIRLRENLLRTWTDVAKIRCVTDGGGPAAPCETGVSRCRHGRNRARSPIVGDGVG